MTREELIKAMFAGKTIESCHADPGEPQTLWRDISSIDGRAGLEQLLTFGPSVAWHFRIAEPIIKHHPLADCADTLRAATRVFNPSAAELEDAFRDCPDASATPAAPDPLAVQVGGSHYKDMAIQPVEYIHKNKIGFCEGSAIKYLSRWRAKGGIKDLQKARHFIDLLIELEQPGAPQ